MQYDLDDNGRIDRSEFVKMLDSLGAGVSAEEAEAAMDVSQHDVELLNHLMLDQAAHQCL